VASVCAKVEACLVDARATAAVTRNHAMTASQHGEHERAPENPVAPRMTTLMAVGRHPDECACSRARWPLEDRLAASRPATDLDDRVAWARVERGRGDDLELIRAGDDCRERHAFQVATAAD